MIDEQTTWINVLETLSRQATTEDGYGKRTAISIIQNDNTWTFLLTSVVSWNKLSDFNWTLLKQKDERLFDQAQIFRILNI